ncbi:MAG: sigma-70 family RNA polymerase sigma factor [Armatimonadetes bacterium]|nr:sigma-70 family RNA polymerase sigma factor [Armatimonadota bacterium]NIM24778.1 sigma-70 family RNA polymerase sigma factor [Armatimonadota bacterium]NIM68667.1 sigma-70 family RNA polymerase sigma factor [Armatimonadota bacterium]NIM76964.1 sigma-70 family RNA polymerase sigma factor [Armatimonadota bacterium]NIN06870.1 sigma-70 family RNA polymerase sigma factor [Armatimonadota bacterium]
MTAAMNAIVSQQIWNYIRTLGVDRDTARDLFQEAQAAVWEAAEMRATRECQAYLVKTAIGAIRHWLRDKYCLIRVPGYLHDRGEAAEHTKAILPLDDFTDSGDGHFEDQLLEGLNFKQQKDRVMRLLPHLSRAERLVMEGLLSGRSIREIARKRKVRVGCVYAQRSRAIDKLRRLLIQQQAA